MCEKGGCEAMLKCSQGQSTPVPLMEETSTGLITERLSDQERLFCTQVQMYKERKRAPSQPCRW